MKAREFVRDYVKPAGGVLQRKDGDHHVYRMPCGRKIAVPMGGRQTEVSQSLVAQLRRIVGAVTLQVATVAIAAMVLVGCGGTPFTDGAAEVGVPSDDDGGAVLGEAATPGPADAGARDAAPRSDRLAPDSDAGSRGGDAAAGDGSDAGDAGAAGCAAGATVCVGSQPVVCSAGAWVSAGPGCYGAAAVCLDGACVACSPGATQCAGGVQPQVCGASGAWQDSGSPVTHSDGVGQTWQDCAPIGTYDQAEALRACEAHSGNAALCVVGAGCGSGTIVVTDTASGYVWGYSDTTIGYVAPGGNSCPTATGPNVKRWE